MAIKGKGFKDGASAIFGGTPATLVSVDPKGELMIVQPPFHVEGDVDVVVKNPDGGISDIAKGAYSYHCPPVSETELFLLVVFAGALGGALHGLRSLYWYVGLRSLLKSWTLMYVLLPFTGASIAIIFYAVIRAGLLPVPANKDASVAVVAIAIIVGLFSQQAAVKLKDIAEALLAKPQPGPPNESKPQGSLPPGTSSAGKPSSPAPKPAVDPTHGHPGDKIKVTGTGMKTVNSITFGGAQLPPANFSVKDDTITITVPDRQAAQVDPKVDVTITGDAAPFKFTFTYE